MSSPSPSEQQLLRSQLRTMMLMGNGDLDGAPSGTLPGMFYDYASVRLTTDVELSDGEDCVVFTQPPDLARETLLPVMDELRRTDQLCDVTIKVSGPSGGVEDLHSSPSHPPAGFRAHKVVLAAAVPYFRAMFTGGLAESRSDVVEFRVGEGDGLGAPHPDAGSVEAVINFAYSGKVTISTGNVQNLLTAAAFFQLTQVRNACAEFLLTKLTPHNVVGVWSFAEAFGCFALGQACHRFVHRFFTQVSDQNEFLSLPLSKVAEVIASDELDVKSEEVVFEAVMAWVKVDSVEREPHLPQLLACVRLPLLTPHYLSDKVASEDLIRKSMRCRDLLDEAKDFHLMPERRQLLQSFRTVPRRGSDTSGLIYAVGGVTNSGNSLSTVEVFNPSSGIWKDAEAMSMMRSRVGVAVLNCRLYAIGGYNGVERLNTVEEFDSDKKVWRRVAPMNCKRSAMGAIAVRDHLYVCGGFDGVSSLDSVERYSPASDTWTKLSPMNKSRSATGLAHLYGKIYTLGGHNGLSIFATVECYDIAKGIWLECKPMLTKRCRLGVAALYGKIYACGGYDGSSFLKSVEVYDPVTERWSFVKPMNETRSRVAVVANMGRVYAIGGYDGMKNLSTVETYDPETDEWTFVAEMESHEGGVGVGVVPMLFP